MPDWQQAISKIDLGDLRNWDVTKFWEDMKFERAEPTPRDAFLSEFCLTCFESITRNISEKV